MVNRFVTGDLPALRGRCLQMNGEVKSILYFATMPFNALPMQAREAILESSLRTLKRHAEHSSRVASVTCPASAAFCK